MTPLGERMNGDYTPPILSKPKGGPVPKWTESPPPKRDLKRPRDKDRD